MSQIISKGKMVSLHFQLYSQDQSPLGGTDGQDPLQYIHGLMALDPPGLERYLEGKEEGFIGKVTLPPAEAYGERLLSPEESMMQLPLSAFPGNMNIQVGAMFMADIGGKGELPITIMAIQGDEVMVHYGHPLAGHTIIIDVHVIGVREASPEELSMIPS
jgi:FKBP-type peptidyl-prolyl cis-trans isomerase SlyD